ncbi:unnamed protein product [Closterium sp. NIES-53]
MSKPLANAIKRRAKSHPKFRGTIINFAQSYHKINVGMQRRLYGYSTNVDIKPLIEEKAVETAADLVGELVVFGVAGGVVVAEYTRSSIADSRKEEKRRQEREALRQKDLELERELQMLKARLDALESTASDSWLPRILRGSTILGGGNRSTTSPAENSSGSGTSEVETTESHEEEDEHVPEETVIVRKNPFPYFASLLIAYNPDSTPQYSVTTRDIRLDTIPATVHDATQPHGSVGSQRSGPPPRKLPKHRHQARRAPHFPTLPDQAPPLVVLSRKHARPRQRLSLSLPDTPAMAELSIATLTQEQLDRLMRQLEESALEIATLTAERDSARQQSTVNAPAPTHAPAHSEDPTVISSGTPAQNDSVGQRSGAASEGATHSMPGMERKRTAPSPREPRESQRHVEFAATSGEYTVTTPMPLKQHRLPCFDPSQRGGPTVQSWVFTMNVFFDANYVESDAAKIRYAVLLLRGPAMD